MDEQVAAGAEVERLLHATRELASILGSQPEAIIGALAEIIRRRIAFERVKAELAAAPID